jgi:hypothetical protein
MIGEGCYIVLSKKQITPLPSRILYGLGVVTVGSEKSRNLFSGRTSLKDLHAYAWCTLVFGLFILISSFVYLFSAVL